MSLVQSPKIARTLAEAAVRVESWKNQGLEVVFTNGCFDLLHAGHVQNLREAAALGDRLVVAINSDASVRRLKGERRPISGQDSRLAVLAALEMVDLVLIFEEDTPLGVIEGLLPDVLAKGGDYAVEQIVGHEVVLERGGKVFSLPLLAGYSTTALETKIREA